MKRMRLLAGGMICLSVCLILYGVSFYAGCFLENMREKNTYEQMRSACIRKDFKTEDEKNAGAEKGEADRADIHKTDTEKTILSDAGESASEEKIKESFGISWENLRKVSPKIIGWIEIPGADISYPILQGTDDEYYLHHAPDGTESPFGSIFLGADHERDFLDSHNLVYGHNMEGGMMFANLNKYENPEFYRQCPVFTITTPQRRFTYEIFSVEQAGPGSSCYVYGYERTSSVYKQQLADLKAGSVYDTGVEPDGEGCVVTLITCNSRLEPDVRMAIHGISRNVENRD